MKALAIIPIAALAAGMITILPVQAQDASQTETPPTTLPFEPTVESAPPARPSYPDRTPQPEPEPPDTLCTAIGPIVRAGVVASRFAMLSPSTAQGGVIGTFEAGEGLGEVGAETCTVVIPAANEATADSPYNQVTCPLEMLHGDVPFLNDLRQRREEVATRIGECPAISRWTGEAPPESPFTEAEIVEDHVFSHPDVAVEIVLRATHRKRVGDWPLDYVRSLALIFRTPNPDRPEPEAEPDPGPDASGGTLP
ncbi:MAG: hypothetical protein RIB03_11055 [Henriciella sp.]|uniref:hypothetical protein n=1 Tax=Henriciella sp. TaxID=1968823 RepID=UPI0032F06491